MTYQYLTCHWTWQIAMNLSNKSNETRVENFILAITDIAKPVNVIVMQSMWKKNCTVLYNVIYHKLIIRHCCCWYCKLFVDELCESRRFLLGQRALLLFLNSLRHRISANKIDPCCTEVLLRFKWNKIGIFLLIKKLHNVKT